MNDAGIERATELLRRRVTALRHRTAADDTRARESQARAAEFSDAQLADLRRQLDAVVQNVALLSAKLETVADGMRERHEAVTQNAALVSAQVEAVADGMRERYEAIAQQLVAVTALSESRPVYRPTVRGGRDDVIATIIDGLLVAVPAEELRLALYHAFYGFQEPGVRKIFGGLVRTGHTVVDVGASIGMYSLCAAQLVGETGSVIAFEPTPRTFSVLVENLKFNGFWDNGLVRAYELALGETGGAATLYSYPGDFGFNTLYRRREGGEEIAIRVASFDALFPDMHVDVVKIDVEGAEPAVLAGMAKAIARNPEIAIIMEFAPSHLQRAGVDATVFAEQLIRGFDAVVVDVLDGTTRAASVDELSRCFSMNLLLKPCPRAAAT